jgi:hypothetical protein
MIFFIGLKIFKLLQVLIVSGIKFLFAPLVSIGYGFNYIQTALITALGGILGILFFYFLSKWIIAQYIKYSPTIYSYFTGEKNSNFQKITSAGIWFKKEVHLEKQADHQYQKQIWIFWLNYLYPGSAFHPFGGLSCTKILFRKKQHPDIHEYFGGFVVLFYFLYFLSFLNYYIVIPH